MSLAYDEYLAEHIGNVNKGLHWMLDNLPLTQEEKSAIETAMVEFCHDESKYDTAEYDAYDQYFYGGNQSYAVKLAFNYAWLHHIHHNPHHWQYWVLLEDDPETGVVPFKTLQIPLPYIFEMVADWWTFSWKNNNLFEIFNWYADHRHKQFIHPESRAILENILKKIWNVLIMQETVAGHDVSEIEAQYMRVWAEQDVDLLNWDHPSAQVIGKVVGTRETENGLEVTVEKEPETFNYHFIHKGEPSDNVSMKESTEPVPDILFSQPGISITDGSLGTEYTKEFIEKLEHSDDDEDDKHRYGIPSLKKFPMPDKRHVKSAIRFFNYVDPKHEKELANAILSRIKEFGMVLGEDITVGDDNRFKKYLPEEKES